jgi:hypothetical protein
VNAVAALDSWPLWLFFIPFYGLATLAVAAHLCTSAERSAGVEALKPALAQGLVLVTAVIVLMIGAAHKLTAGGAGLGLLP